jgi:hypothetical protein
LSSASRSVRYSLSDTGSRWLFSLRKKSISTRAFYRGAKMAAYSLLLPLVRFAKRLFVTFIFRWERT